MTWKPIDLESLSTMIAQATARMTRMELALWELIRVTPRRWPQHPWGDDGGGFWVVAILGPRCLWYNDIEDGFNWSSWSVSGVIEQYGAGQDSLDFVVHQIFA